LGWKQIWHLVSLTLHCTIWEWRIWLLGLWPSVECHSVWSFLGPCNGEDAWPSPFVLHQHLHSKFPSAAAGCSVLDTISHSQILCLLPPGLRPLNAFLSPETTTSPLFLRLFPDSFIIWSAKLSVNHGSSFSVILSLFYFHV
jgi:hypothetical protein